MVGGGPEDGADAVPADVAEGAEGIEVGAHADVVCEKVWAAGEGEGAVDLMERILSERGHSRVIDYKKQLRCMCLDFDKR